MVNKKISWILILISAILYVSACLFLRWGQVRLIFLPDSSIKSTPQKHNLDYQDVWIEIEKEKIHGWWIPSAKKSAPVLLYFHGNASNNGDLVDLAYLFHQLEFSVMLIDYRGYGKSSPIFPSEKRVYQDAEAAWQYLIDERQLEPQNIFVYGHSLGGAIAIDLASKYPEMAGLIVEGTFTSIAEIAKSGTVLRIFPLNWIITERFDSITKIGSLKTPILIIHGTEDRTIPVEMAAELFVVAPEPKQLVIIPQAGHNNIAEVGGQDYISNLQKFIQTHR